MRFFIDKLARKAYLFADTTVEEVSLKIIYSHLVGAMPNTIKLHGTMKEEGFQIVPAHIEFQDSSARFGAK